MEKLTVEDNYWNKKYEYLLDRELFQKGPKFSEHGEDRIVEMIFNKLKPVNKWFVDAGCASRRSSNVFDLIEHGWKGILIDFEPIQLREMRELVKDKEGVAVLDTFITPKKPNNLDRILHEQGVPKDFDFLSIDVDSFEYEIWKNLKDFTPNVVCIEVNQGNIGDFETIDYEPSGTLWKYNKRKNAWSGATAGLMNKLADEKGYDYLCWIVSNIFYVKRSFLNAS